MFQKTIHLPLIEVAVFSPSWDKIGALSKLSLLVKSYANQLTIMIISILSDRVTTILQFFFQTICIYFLITLLSLRIANALRVKYTRALI